MDNTKNDNYYLEKIKSDIVFIVEHMKDVDLQELNRIVHDYGNVDLDIVFETLKYDIPELLEQLKE
jgi:uncharacterized protein with HEPN domain